MKSFSDFLNESMQPALLNEKVKFTADNDSKMISTVADFESWFYSGSRVAYTSDGKYSFSRYNSGPKTSLHVTDTSKYGKSGNSDAYAIYMTDTSKLINSITSIDTIVDTAQSLLDDGVEQVSRDQVKNMSADCFNPVMLKNFKSVGSVASKDKITKAQARKIVASGDFKNITHRYQMRDDNYNSDGAVKLTYAVLSDILGDLDSKHTSILNRRGSESFTIYVHSNLTYDVNRD